MTIESDFGRLLGDLNAENEGLRDGQLAKLILMARDAARALRDVHEANERQTNMLTELDRRLVDMERKMTAANESLQIVRDTVTTARTLHRVAKWVGGILVTAATVASIWWTMFRSGGDPPIGPGP